jgi:hypothetical protein
MNEDQIKEVEARIIDLKKRWPAHSVPPGMMQELDELEEELADLLSTTEKDTQTKENHHA